MRCHWCTERISTIDNSVTVKCKLCCDGLEQEYCGYCSVLYSSYKDAVINDNPVSTLKKLLVNRRKEVKSAITKKALGYTPKA
jgi:hypothetical protein